MFVMFTPVERTTNGVRMIDQREDSAANRRHFFATAARAMRRILVDHARRRDAERRGGTHAPTHAYCMVSNMPRTRPHRIRIDTLVIKITTSVRDHDIKIFPVYKF